MPWRALIVGSVSPVAAGVVRAWTDAGNEVAGFWHASSAGFVRRDRRLAWLVPRWSVAASGRQHRFPIGQVPRLAAWPQAADAAEATGADVLIGAYFRYLVPRQVLDIFGSRAVNFHPAPLPRHRGPDPVTAMVLDRSILTDGGMTLHVLDEAFDHGPIVAREPVSLSSDLDIGRYHVDLAQAAARLTAGALQRYLAGEIAPVPQDGGQATYAKLPAESRDIRPEMTADEIRWRCRTLARRPPGQDRWHRSRHRDGISRHPRSAEGRAADRRCAQRRIRRRRRPGQPLAEVAGDESDSASAPPCRPCQNPCLVMPGRWPQRSV